MVSYFPVQLTVSSTFVAVTFMAFLCINASVYFLINMNSRMVILEHLHIEIYDFIENFFFLYYIRHYLNFKNRR